MELGFKVVDIYIQRFQMKEKKKRHEIYIKEFSNLLPRRNRAREEGEFGVGMEKQKIKIWCASFSIVAANPEIQHEEKTNSRKYYISRIRKFWSRFSCRNIQQDYKKIR